MKDQVLLEEEVKKINFKDEFETEEEKEKKRRRKKNQWEPSDSINKDSIKHNTYPKKGKDEGRKWRKVMTAENLYIKTNGTPRLFKLKNLHNNT